MNNDIRLQPLTPEEEERYDQLTNRSDDDEYLTDADEIREAVDLYCRKEGVVLDFRFVPFSVSRSRKNDFRSVNWVVTVKKMDEKDTRAPEYRVDKARTEVEYMEGIGNFISTGYGRKSVDAHKAEIEISERCECTAAAFGSGAGELRKQLRIERFQKKAIKHYEGKPKVVKTFTSQVQPPPYADIFYSLSRDVDVENYPVYEEWAREFGYDEDSREGERIYNVCRRQAYELSKVIGRESINKLRELTQQL